RANLVANAPEYVELPERVEPGAIRGDRARLVGEARNRFAPAIRNRADRGGGIPIELEIIEDGPGLIEPRHGDAHVVVRREGARHQPIEHRVLELSPPPRIERLPDDER